MTVAERYKGPTGPPPVGAIRLDVLAQVVRWGFAVGRIRCPSKDVDTVVAWFGSFMEGAGPPQIPTRTCGHPPSDHVTVDYGGSTRGVECQKCACMGRHW